ncbi:MAG: TspO/MBR family protein [Candidatus Shapirobacteria bacterium]
MKLLISILVCELSGVIGSIFTISSVKTWYVTDLVKPSFNPPSWLFGPVWTTLFLLMGVALYLVWQRKKISKWFWIQLLLNILWSVLFFGVKRPDLAFLEIVVLWIAILKTILEFGKVNKKAGRLLWPYLLWVSFAAFLNLMIVRLN